MAKVSVRGVVFSALFAALVVVFSYLNVDLGFTPVPITLENLAVMLAGAILGPVYGFFSLLLVVVLTALGLPLLHGEGGMKVILGPTGGYIWMYPLNALLTGFFVRRIKGNRIGSFILIFLSVEVFGSLFTYLGGVPWLAHVLHISLNKALVGGMYPFLPGDAIKAFVTALVVLPIRALFPVERITGGLQNSVAKLDAS